jgi:hypothetical protein
MNRPRTDAGQPAAPPPDPSAAPDPGAPAGHDPAPCDEGGEAPCFAHLIEQDDDER